MAVAVNTGNLVLRRRRPHRYRTHGVLVHSNVLAMLCLTTDPRFRATAYGVINTAVFFLGGVVIFCAGMWRDQHISLNLIFNIGLIGWALAGGCCSRSGRFQRGIDRSTIRAIYAIPRRRLLAYSASTGPVLAGETSGGSRLIGRIGYSVTIYFPYPIAQKNWHLSSLVALVCYWLHQNRGPTGSAFVP